jgi:gamma-glutamyltranspeptidase/glutathione hydrolase
MRVVLQVEAAGLPVLAEHGYHAPVTMGSLGMATALTGIIAGIWLVAGISPADVPRDRKPAVDPPAPEWIVRGRRCMVASDHPLASQAGLEILRAGGNAVDAACAVSFALAVTRPYSTGLGGGGFLIAWTAESGQATVVDFRETAPAAASGKMYEEATAAKRSRAPPSLYGHLAVAVPALLAGRAWALERLGTKALAEAIAPAIKLAEDGFPVDTDYVEACKTVLGIYEKYPALKDTCSYVYDVHLRRGNLPREGDRLRQPALGRLLRVIADNGADVFYRGAVAEAIEREMRSHGGIITQADLANYSVVVREPLVSTYRGFETLAMPLPSSGGTCLIESLNILENVDLDALAHTNRPLAVHYIVEAMKHAFADRARWMADADLVHVPTGFLTSTAYARRLVAKIAPDAVSEVDNYGIRQVPDDGGTSHFSVIDRWGNCVVSTETISTEFGSLAAVAEWGLILNNEMDDFAARSGKPNAYGLTQSDRNAPAPGKRPLSSMSPTMVFKDGKPVLLLGASGGPRIISSVLNVIVNVLDFGWPLERAIAAPRVHHQWLPNEVVFDRTPDEALAGALRKQGHATATYRKRGVVQAILIRDGDLIGASDPRKGGRPAGY